MTLQPRVHSYKHVTGTTLHADLYPATTTARLTPVVVAFHGGGLIFGSRRWLNPLLLQRLLAAGYAVLAVDYRLAPETKLASILDDVTDACAWVREQSPQLGVDATRLAVLGDSRGGYLALLTGQHVAPRPQVIVSLYGYGDITGDWYTTPSSFYLQQPLVSRDAAIAVVGQAAIADAPTIDRLPFYVYCRQNGVWPNEVVGRDPRQERDAFARYCPAWNVDAAFPPTLLLHGTKDEDVPFAQSQQMAQD